MSRTIIKSFAAFAEPASLRRPAIRRADGRCGLLGPWRLGATLHQRDGVAIVEARPEYAVEGRAPYVVKRIIAEAPAPQTVESFRREASAAAAVRSPHVVAVLATHVEQPPYYFVMPRLRGRSLEQVLIRRGALPTAFALAIARQTAQGLSALHAAGRLHGDVKPGNIFISPEGHVTLIDLGFARRFEEEIDTAEQYVLGTVDYLAPEAVCSRLRVDGRSDLYSLGVVLYETLAGRLPFRAATTAEMVAAHVSAEPPPLREAAPCVPHDVAELVGRLLRKQPLARPQSAAEVVDRLARLEIAYLDER